MNIRDGIELFLLFSRSLSWRPDRHMLYQIHIILLAICIILLLSMAPANAQEKTNCPNPGGPINDNQDRFLNSWKGYVNGIQIAERKFDDEDKPHETKITLKQDGVGRLSEWFLTNNRIPVFGRHVYDYDPKGRVVKRTSYNPDGSSVLEDIYAYDQIGNLLTKYTRNTKSKVVIGSKQGYKYETPTSYAEFSDDTFVRRIKIMRDDRCRIIESILLKEDGSIENRVSMKFDNHDNLIEQIVFSASGKEIGKSKYEYKYDNRGNWITKRSFEWHYWDSTPNYTLISEELRTINYASH